MGVWMERLVRVEFGPSRSKRFGKAVAEAMGGRGECSELGSGRYRVRFALGKDADAYTGLARLLPKIASAAASSSGESGGRCRTMSRPLHEREEARVRQQPGSASPAQAVESG
jgi:hypothetical protein